jgi:hypothetical protein
MVVNDVRFDDSLDEPQKFLLCQVYVRTGYNPSIRCLALVEGPSSPDKIFTRVGLAWIGTQGGRSHFEGSPIIRTIWRSVFDYCQRMNFQIK